MASEIPKITKTTIFTTQIISDKIIPSWIQTQPVRLLFQSDSSIDGIQVPKPVFTNV